MNSTEFLTIIAALAMIYLRIWRVCDWLEKIHEQQKKGKPS
jgi:hypothetical protein